MLSLILALSLPMLAEGFCPADVTTAVFRPVTNAGWRARHGIHLSRFLSRPGIHLSRRDGLQRSAGMRMEADGGVGIELPGTWVLTAKYEVRHGCLGGGGVTAVLLTG